MKRIIIHASINALTTALYVALVSSFMFYAPRVPDEKISVLFPMAMLMLFVFSAAFTGSMVFGKPVLWYLDGKKKEAVQLLAATLAIFFCITVAVLSGIALLFL